MRRSGRCTTVAVLLGIWTFAPTGWADAPEATAGTGAAAIEEIVVTARKRPERLRDVPTSLTVLDGALLDTLGVRRLGEVERRLPNLAGNGSPLTGFGARYLRGLNAQARNIGFDSGYGVFVDGVYAGRYVSADRVLQNVDRIEYLPGPQGTLFGRNTTLGVVNIVTRAPGPKPSADVYLDLGSDGYRDLRGAASLPLGGDWAVSATAGQRQRDGLVQNRLLGTDGNNIDHWDARAALSGTLAGWQIDVAVDHYESTPDLIARQRLDGFGALPPRTAENDLPETLRDEDAGVSLTASRDTALGTFTSISALRRADTRADIDDDAWALPVQHLVGWEESVDQRTQELRLAGDRGRFNYLTGLYYQSQTAESSRSVASFFGAARADGRVESDTTAVFAQAGYAFTPRLDGELGLRWSREHKDLPRYAQDGGGVLLDFARSDERTVTDLSPSASLGYQVSERARAYLRYAQGFKSGGFNVDLITAPAVTPLEFDDEQVDTVEAGIKSTWLDQRLRLDLAVFHSKYRDLQVSQYEVLPGATLPTLRITNAASATTRGAELTAELVVAQWLVATAVGYADSELDDFADPLGPGTGNWVGNSLGGPEWTTSLLVQYSRTLGGSTELTVTAEHLYQDTLGGDLSGDRLATSDSLSLVNLSAELAFGGERRWAVRAWVDNVFDRDRVIERRRSAAPGLLTLLGFPPEIADSTVGLYNDPRTYGLQVSLSL
ncbi:MAG: TonB-dependent receptor [Pseudomonadales bacterium]